MKKQSHNITAYISKYLLYTGKPNQDSQCQLTTSNSKKFDDSFPNQSFHNQIVGQMDQSASNYLKKLMKKAEKDQQKCRSSQKSLNHERAKSYANLTIDTPSRTQNIPSKGHTHRNHEDDSSTKPNGFFFSVCNSPMNQKINKKQLKFQNQEVEVKSKSFLSHVQDFITKLEKNKPITLIQDLNQQQIKQRKTVQRSRQNSIQNTKIKEKLEGILQKEKKLKLENKFLESQVIQKRKVVKRKKNQCQKLVEGMQYEIYKLHSQIQQQRKKRKNLQKIIFEVQKTFTSLRGQPRASQKVFKTRYSPHSNYLINQSQTERSVDTLEQSMTDPFRKNERLSYNGQKRVLNLQEMSAMFSKINFDGQNMIGDQLEEQMY